MTELRFLLTGAIVAALGCVGCGAEETRPATTVASSSSSAGVGGGGAGGSGGADACVALGDSLQQAVEQAVTLPKGGNALAVITEECGTWVGTAGEGHDGLPLDPEHLLRVGSVTKTYVAAAALLLSAEGDIDLDGTLEPWVPGVPNGATITIRQLLNHTSGIYNYTDATFVQQALSDPGRVWTPQELVDIAVQHGPDFEPGSDWAYSNTNYILLGMVVEQASGQPVAEFMRERLLTVHGLGNTFLDGDEPLEGDLATGYGITGDDVTHALNPSAAWSAGAMVARAEDVAAWAAALYRGDVLAAPEMRAMLTMVPTGSDGVEYGLGVFGFGPQVLAGHEGVGHGGDIPGFHTIMLYLTDYDTIVVSIVNNDAANPARALANALPLLTGN